MARNGLLALAAGCALFAAPAAFAADCYDLSRGEPGELTGTLDYVVFPGPPNFKDVRGGDAPEPNYVLRLSSPICLTGDDAADPEKPFKAVQVMPTDATAGALRGFIGREVTLRLERPMAAETGHHHEPLVAFASAARLADANRVEVEYGSAASTVRALYEALGRGAGDVAALLIAPERRGVPAFSPSAMSRFYGGLKQHLRLTSLAPAGPDAFLVSYRYATATRVCDGRALVTTHARDGASYIDSIRALNGC